MIVDAAGSGWRTLVDANPGYELRYGFHADISPDGQRVVYSSCEFPTGAKSERGSFNYEIASVNLDGSDPRRLTENEGPDLFPAWSSDGANLALFSSEVYWSNHPELDIIRYGGPTKDIRGLRTPWTEKKVLYIILPNGNQMERD